MNEREALQEIAGLPPGCTSSADKAIELARDALGIGEDLMGSGTDPAFDTEAPDLRDIRLAGLYAQRLGSLANLAAKRSDLTHASVWKPTPGSAAIVTVWQDGGPALVIEDTRLVRSVLLAMGVEVRV